MIKIILLFCTILFAQDLQTQLNKLTDINSELAKKHGNNQVIKSLPLISQTRPFIDFSYSISARVSALSYKVQLLDQENQMLKSSLNILIENALVQAQTVKDNDSKGSRTDLILNIIFGIIAIVSGGGASLYWKNRKIIKLPIIHKDTTAIAHEDFGEKKE